MKSKHESINEIIKTMKDAQALDTKKISKKIAVTLII